MCVLQEGGENGGARRGAGPGKVRSCCEKGQKLQEVCNLLSPQFPRALHGGDNPVFYMSMGALSTRI